MMKCPITGCSNCCGEAKAEGFLRLGLGLFLLLIGINKFLMGFTDVANQMVQPFADTWFPSRVALIWLYLVPFIEVILGAGLIFLCKHKKSFYCATGVFLLVMLFGTTVMGDMNAIQGNFLLLLVLSYAMTRCCECGGKMEKR